MNQAIEAILEEAIAEVLAEEMAERLKAKDLRNQIELTILSPLLDVALKEETAVMAQWWALRLTLDPIIKYLRLVESGHKAVGEVFLAVVDAAEKEIQMPAMIAMHLVR